MDIMKCTSCYGRKTILGLGMIEKECDNCSGVGYVENTSYDTQEEAVKDEIFANEIIKENKKEFSQPIAKRRGRPKAGK